MVERAANNRTLYRRSDYTRSLFSADGISALSQIRANVSV